MKEFQEILFFFNESLAKDEIVNNRDFRKVLIDYLRKIVQAKQYL